MKKDFKDIDELFKSKLYNRDLEPDSSDFEKVLELMNKNKTTPKGGSSFGKGKWGGIILALLLISSFTIYQLIPKNEVSIGNEKKQTENSNSDVNSNSLEKLKEDSALAEIKAKSKASFQDELQNVNELDKPEKTPITIDDHLELNSHDIKNLHKEHSNFVPENFQNDNFSNSDLNSNKNNSNLNIINVKKNNDKVNISKENSINNNAKDTNLNIIHNTAQNSQPKPKITLDDHLELEDKDLHLKDSDIIEIYSANTGNTSEKSKNENSTEIVPNEKTFEKSILTLNYFKIFGLKNIDSPLNSNLDLQKENDSLLREAAKKTYRRKKIAFSLGVYGLMEGKGQNNVIETTLGTEYNQRGSKLGLALEPELKLGKFNLTTGLTYFGQTINFTSLSQNTTKKYFNRDSTFVTDSLVLIGYDSVFQQPIYAHFYDTTTVTFVDSSLTSSNIKNESKSKTTWIEIPLLVGYSFELDKWEMGIKAGGSYSLALGKEVLQKSYMNMLIRINISYKFTDKFLVRIEPTFRRSLLKTGDKKGENYLGGRLGFIYRF